jgi:hypothetical protein
MVQSAFKSKYKRNRRRPWLNLERKLGSLPHESLITVPHTLMLSPCRALNRPYNSRNNQYQRGATTGYPEALRLIRHSLDRCP